MDKKTENRSVDPVWDAIESHLLDVKRTALRELRNYPQPIAGCDAQIPALWEKRDGIAAELDRLAEARKEGSVDAFIATSPFIDDDRKKTFRELIGPKIRSAAE